VAYEDVLGRALDEAYNRGTIDYDHPDSVERLRDDFGEIAFDKEGNPLDHFPSADEIDPRDWKDWLDFLDEYELWEEFRDEWERYDEKSA
jgi:hypothetical protein